MVEMVPNNCYCYYYLLFEYNPYCTFQYVKITTQSYLAVKVNLKKKVTARHTLYEFRKKFIVFRINRWNRKTY